MAIVWNPTDCAHARRAVVLPLLGLSICGSSFEVCADCGAVETAGGGWARCDLSYDNGSANLILEFPAPVMKRKVVAVAVMVQHRNRFAGIRSVKHAGGVGFIGGKVLPGETLEEAAKRESLEESGLVLHDVEIIGAREDGEVLCVLAFAHVWRWMRDHRVDLVSSAEGEAVWLPSSDLTSPDLGPFPEWNTWAFELALAAGYIQ